MGIESMVFDFDMGRKEYIKKMKEYNITVDETVIKSDKEYFRAHYEIDLDKYLHKGRKFIIPYEMADLFCLMMTVMKTSPTYDKRKKNISLRDISSHNEDIVKFLGNLPSEIADYIEETPEYESALAFIDCLPIAVERMAALLHITLKNGDPNDIFRLIDDLDDLYERHFWNVEKADVAEANPPIPIVAAEDPYIQSLVDRISAETSAILDSDADSTDFIKMGETIGKRLENEFKDIKLEDILAAQKILMQPLLHSRITTETFNAYHIFDNMLADLFKALDRDNWPEGTESTVTDLLEQWQNKYKGDEDRDAKIKSEYLSWLCDNDWHVLCGVSGIDQGSCLEELAEEYNDRYNKKALILPKFLGDKSGSNEREKGKAEERREHEIAQIKLSLQNEIDIHLLDELGRQLRTKQLHRYGITKFTEQLHGHTSKWLSRSIFLFIVDLLNNNPAESVHSLLESYISSTRKLLVRYDNMYAAHGLKKYVMAVVNGEKDIDGCCDEIYGEVFVKIQSQKCDYFVENKKDYQELRDSIMLSAGNMFTEIIKKESKPTAQTTRTIWK